MTRRSLLLAATLALALGGCAGALDPSGVGARRIAGLWWLMLWLGVVAFVVVMGALAVAVARRRTELDDEAVRWWIPGSVVLSVALLIPVSTMTVVTALNMSSDEPDPVRITVTGHQYWWDLVYETGDGEGFRTANEVHIPVGRPVDLTLESADVIHSFWIPELHGKIDLIPGRTNELRLEAERAGTFMGQCAEFCGLAHAQMRLMVVAHPEEAFQAWLEQEQAPAEVVAEIGVLQEFADSCAPCHTVRGLFEEPMYEGDFGPDLTGIASRRMLASNIIPNTREGLARWIVDPDGVKPGTRMPDVRLAGDELNDVLSLLEQLD